MPLLDEQPVAQRNGEIRWGLAEGKRPKRLDVFRFTTYSDVIAARVAELFGGDVEPWGKKFEVITKTNRIPILLPPDGDIFRQDYELWTNKRRLRLCDSRVERLTGGPCLCPHAEDPTDRDAVERARLERMELAKVGKACKPTTILRVRVPSLPDCGYWLMATHSRNAARELEQKIAAMAVYRQAGKFIGAWAMLTWRETLINDKPTPYPVIVIDLVDSIHELAAGTAGTTLAGALPPMPGQTARVAITAGPTREDRPALEAPAPNRYANPQLRPAGFAQMLADATTREEVEEIQAAISARGWLDKEVYPPTQPEPDTGTDDGIVDAEIACTLDDYTRTRWRELPRTPQPAQTPTDETWPQDPEGGQ